MSSLSNATERFFSKGLLALLQRYSHGDYSTILTQVAMGLGIAAGLIALFMLVGFMPPLPVEIPAFLMMDLDMLSFIALPLISVVHALFTENLEMMAEESILALFLSVTLMALCNLGLLGLQAFTFIPGVGASLLALQVLDYLEVGISLLPVSYCLFAAARALYNPGSFNEFLIDSMAYTAGNFMALPAILLGEPCLLVSRGVLTLMGYQPPAPKKPKEDDTPGQGQGRKVLTPYQKYIEDTQKNSKAPSSTVTVDPKLTSSPAGITFNFEDNNPYSITRKIDNTIKGLRKSFGKPK